MKILYSLIFCLIVSTGYGQTTVILQPDPETGKDALVSSRHVSQNIGSTTEFIAAAWTFSGSIGFYRSLIEFDLSSIPVNAQILNARLSLFHNDVSSSAGHEGNNTAYLRRITEPWNENTVTWNSQPSSTDIDEILLAKSTSDDQDYENIDVTTLIQGMHQDPLHNFGFQFMLANESIYKSMKFYTSDAEEASQRPMLEITYTQTIICKTFQPGDEGKDAVAWSILPEVNIGNSPEFIASTWTFGGEEGHYRSFLAFDLTSIPSNAQLVSANLSLYHNNTSSSNGHEGNNSVTLQRISDSWDEQTLTWNNQPGTTDIDEIILPISSNELEDYEDYNVLSLVEDMVANPSLNHGLMMSLVTEEYYRSMKFASGDYEDPGRHPKLDVCYESTVSSKDIPVQQAMVVPNPFTHSFVIHHLQGAYQVMLSDINGRVIYQRKLVADHLGLVIDELTDLTPGMYFVRASGPQEYCAKLVKM